MKNNFFGLLLLILSQSCLSQKIDKHNNEIDSNIIYKNIDYSFKVFVKKDWKIYREVLNDTIGEIAYVDWGIPKIYSEIEKTEIENSVSIRAFKNDEIKNIQDLILNEYLRVDPTTTSMVDEKDIGKNARIIYYNAPNGTKYKGKSYFKYQNGLSYIITFMATPGTYDKNLEKFEQFYLTLILE